MSEHFQSQNQIEAVVAGFESCSTSGDAFTHREHLTVAAWYLRDGNEEQALVRMREGLLRFLTHHGEGLQKYNETITLFWLKLVRQFVAELDPQLSFTQVANAVVDRFDDSRLIFEHYDRARLKTREAKSGWTEPDLKPLL
jgi:spore cortex formation protein SpoVR/YcgB (stage V sporulation)